MTTSRNLVFVSHANPEDNEFALWITLQLAQIGYQVWCDLTKLLGGERFWPEAEKAIRQSAKFLYVLTRTSNAKDGTLDELKTARAVQREHDLPNFIVPLVIDDLRPADFNIQIQNVNAIFFRPSWDRGLKQLVKRLEEDGVPKTKSFSPSIVSEWWKNRFKVDEAITDDSELLSSNWYPVVDLPPVFFHRLRDDRGKINGLVRDEQYPAMPYKGHVVSFAPREDLTRDLRERINFTSQALLGTGASAEVFRSAFAERRAVIDLLRQAWRCLLSRRELPAHEFANGSQALFFKEGIVDRDRLVVPRESGATSRQVLGYKTVSRPGDPLRRRYWHFALEAMPSRIPRLCYVLKPHVLFSDDRQTIWSSKRRLHRARRSQCRSWWNARWRDLINGTARWLAGGGDSIELQVSETRSINVSASPLLVESPVSYDEALAIHDEGGDIESGSHGNDDDRASDDD